MVVKVARSYKYYGLKSNQLDQLFLTGKQTSTMISHDIRGYYRVDSYKKVDGSVNRLWKSSTYANVVDLIKESFEFCGFTDILIEGDLIKIKKVNLQVVDNSLFLIKGEME